MKQSSSRVDLQGAQFWSANLQRAKFWNANLEEANFRNANLREAKSLTIEQLSKAITLYQAKLDTDLEKQVKEKYLHLLEKPKEDSFSL